MSNVCCKEFIGWVKSFTKIERALTVLEAVLLVLLITVLILLILHLIVCSKPDNWADHLTTTTKITSDEGLENPSDIPAEGAGPSVGYNISKSANESTSKPGIKCSWTPSAKTKAGVHYFEDGHTQSSASPPVNKTTHNPFQPIIVDDSTTSDMAAATPSPVQTLETRADEDAELDPDATTAPSLDFEDLIRAELSDGEEAEEEYDKHVVALVKLKPPKDIIFGCILTILSEFWTLTAASCIEAIEETDSLDSFVIMEYYGTNNKRPLQTVDDVQIHPLYEGRNRTYDLAALKSGNSLTRGMRSPVELASFLDYALLTLAQKFIILGYGAFRSIDGGPSGRRLRAAHVYLLPSRQCARAEGAALRHLSGGRALRRGACGPPALCAGVLYSRGLPCNYCAGTPLLVGGARGAGGAALLGLMADAAQCGVACEPALYVNLADVDIADWLDATLRADVVN